MTKHSDNENMHANENERLDDLAHDLEITESAPRGGGIGGTWVSGTLNGHRFQALVFADHAENPDYEIDGDSRISKLWLQRIADGRVVYNWDRGADVTAADPTAASIASFLCDGLAEHVYGNNV